MQSGTRALQILPAISLAILVLQAHGWPAGEPRSAGERRALVVGERQLPHGTPGTELGVHPLTHIRTLVESGEVSRARDRLGELVATLGGELLLPESLDTRLPLRIPSPAEVLSRFHASLPAPGRELLGADPRALGGSPETAGVPRGTWPASPLRWAPAARPLAAAALVRALEAGRLAEARQWAQAPVLTGTLPEVLTGFLDPPAVLPLPDTFPPERLEAPAHWQAVARLPLDRSQVVSPPESAAGITPIDLIPTPQDPQPDLGNRTGCRRLPLPAPIPHAAGDVVVLSTGSRVLGLAAHAAAEDGDDARTGDELLAAERFVRWELPASRLGGADRAALAFAPIPPTPLPGGELCVVIRTALPRDPVFAYAATLSGPDGGAAAERDASDGDGEEGDAPDADDAAQGRPPPPITEDPFERLGRTPWNRLAVLRLREDGSPPVTETPSPLARGLLDATAGCSIASAPLAAGHLLLVVVCSGWRTVELEVIALEIPSGLVRWRRPVGAVEVPAFPLGTVEGLVRRARLVVHGHELVVIHDGGWLARIELTSGALTGILAHPHRGLHERPHRSGGMVAHTTPTLQLAAPRPRTWGPDLVVGHRLVTLPPGAGSLLVIDLHRFDGSMPSSPPPVTPTTQLLGIRPRPDGAGLRVWLVDAGIPIGGDSIDLLAWDLPPEGPPQGAPTPDATGADDVGGGGAAGEAPHVRHRLTLVSIPEEARTGEEGRGPLLAGAITLVGDDLWIPTVAGLEIRPLAQPDSVRLLPWPELAGRPLPGGTVTPLGEESFLVIQHGDEGRQTPSGATLLRPSVAPPGSR